MSNTLKEKLAEATKSHGVHVEDFLQAALENLLEERNLFVEVLDQCEEYGLDADDRDAMEDAVRKVVEA